METMFTYSSAVVILVPLLVIYPPYHQFNMGKPSIYNFHFLKKHTSHTGSYYTFHFLTQ